MSGLLQRAVTALFFVVVMLGGLMTGKYSFVALFGIISLLCLWEYLGMTLENHGSPKDLFRKVMATLFGLSPFVLMALLKLEWTVVESFHVLSGAILLSFPVLFCFFIFELFAACKKPFANVGYTLLGLFYIGIPYTMLLLITFENQTFNPHLALGILLMTWANDTGAYLVGSQIGKTPLLPRISPKKTWEGTLGGFALGLFVAYLMSLFFEELRLQEWLIVAIIVVVFGSIGDLVESMLKRSRGLKDSGNLLPGHGGFLDRFDAFLFCLPFVTAYLLFFR
ncbi:MAG TPA: phosphatidate cytidylyltransferase [Phaeodactylibacter sp.]|nr:phosphatidate cytidylyltransferase [Phaeodactylibacter sp.]